MAFRFLHVADLHLETAFGGRREATRERLRAAVLEAFERAVDVAIERDCHALLAAGDLFDDPILSTRTELFLARQVRRLAEAGVWFLACAGNHDPGHSAGRLFGLGWAREDDPESGEEPRPREPWLERVHLFLEPVPRRVEVTDQGGRPVGWVVGAGHASAAEDSNLASSFPDLRAGLPVVGLLHTQVATARRAEEHDRYAPSTAEDFRRRSYAYWALGHVHLRQQAVEGLPVWYAGNLQGRNPRESGPKGGLLVEAHAGAPAEPEFVRLAPVRWLRLRADDVGATPTLDALRAELARRIAREREDGEELVLVLELAGETPLAVRLRSEEDRLGLEDALAEEPGVLEVQLDASRATPPLDRSVLAGTPSVLAQALELVAAARRDPELLAGLAPSVLAGPVHGADLEEERHAYLAELAEGLEAELQERCLEREEGA